MAKMVSLKLSKKEAKSEYGEVATPSKDTPRYPYGTRIDLDTDTLDKLGIDLSDYDMNDTCTITAKAVVVGKNESQRQGGDPRKSLDLQITDIMIDTGRKKKEKAASAHLDAISKPSEKY